MPRERFTITAEIVKDICNFVRVGGFPHVAAEAAGIPADVLDTWLRRGKGRSDNALYRSLLDGLRTAKAVARLKTEVEIFSKDPRMWLRQGPGKETTTCPGWSAAPRAVFRPAEPSVNDDVMRLFYSLAEQFKGDPQLRSVAIQLLEETDRFRDL